MFKAALANSKVLTAIFNAISLLIEETHLNANPDGIKLNAMDDSHVAMLRATLPKDIFTDYKCDGDFKIGINVQDFIKILRRAKTNDEIELILAEDKNSLKIKMKSQKSTRTFKLKSKEIREMEEGTEQILENLEEALKDKFTAIIELEGAILDEIVKDTSIISDIIKIQVLHAEKMVNFTAFDESGEVEVELDFEGGGILDKDVSGDSEGMYSLNFLDNILKIQAVVNSFELAMGMNQPLKVSGVIQSEDGDPTDGQIVYLLAPRVEDEEEEDYGEDFDFDDMDETFDEDFEIDLD